MVFDYLDSFNKIETKVIPYNNTILPELLKTGFTCVHVNIRGIKSNFDKFCVSLNETLQSTDIVILTETGHMGDKIPGISLPNFNSVFSKLQFNKCGGVVLFIRNTILTVRTKEFVLEGASCIVADLEVQGIKWTIVAVYRSPNGSEMLFIEGMCKLLEELNNSTNIIWAGDININIKSDIFSRVENDYISILNEHKLVSYINAYTRVSMRGAKSCIDHMFGNFHNKYNIVPIVLETSFTDHYTTMVHCDARPSSAAGDGSLVISTLNKNKLLTLVTEERWENVYQSEDINTATSNFIKTLQTHIKTATTEVVKKVIQNLEK